MNCVSCDIYVYHLLVCLCFFPGVFLSSGVTGACPLTTDLIMRVNVRTTTHHGTPDRRDSRAARTQRANVSVDENLFELTAELYFP